MREYSKRLAVLIIALSALSFITPTLSSAAVPSVMNFQAILLDDQGQIVPDSTYDIVFTIHPDSVGFPPDIAIWTELKTVETSGGLFNTMLGTSSPLTAEVFAVEAWLQMRLASSTEPFLPRTRIGATPYTYRVASLDGSKAGEVSGKLVVDTAEVGRAGIPGRLSVIQGSATDGAVFQPYGSHGTSLRINDEAGNACVQLRPDNSGEGGWIYVHRNAAMAAGFTVEGNTDGTFEPSMRISGSTQVAEFDMSQTGSSSVFLPNSAIEASEILDEPGVASNVLGNTVAIDAMRKNILSRSITVPTDGYVLAIGTVQLKYNTSDSIMIGLDNSPLSWGDSAKFRCGKEESGQLREEVITVSATFPIAAGTDVIYLIGGWAEPPSSPVTVSKGTLNLLFVPTSYGTVTPPVSAGQSGVTAQEAASDGFSESQHVNSERIARELAAVKARLLELEQALERTE